MVMYVKNEIVFGFLNDTKKTKKKAKEKRNAIRVSFTVSDKLKHGWNGFNEILTFPDI